MFCPRCGTPNQEGDRFCSSCGASLTDRSGSSEPASTRQKLGSLIGTSRKARLVTLATVLAIVAAIVAFIALKPDEEGIPRDAYTVKADHLCVTSKAGIVAVERQYGHGDAGLSTLATELLPIVASWRTQLGELTVPSDRVELARQLEAALLEAEAQIGGLARIAKTGDPQEIIAKARQVDASTAAVEDASSSLGLTKCEQTAIGFQANKG